MDRMEKCIASVKRNFTSIRTGRASPDMLDRVMVNPNCLACPSCLPFNLKATDMISMSSVLLCKDFNIVFFAVETSEPEDLAGYITLQDRAA